MKIPVLYLCLYFILSCSGSKRGEINKNTGDNNCKLTVYTNNEQDIMDFDEFIRSKNLKNKKPYELIDFLKRRSNIPALIIPYCRIPNGWVKRENIDQLIPYLSDSTKTPRIITLNDQFKNNTLEEQLAITSSASKEALRLINSYFLKYYPCDIKYSEVEVKKMLSN